MVLIGLVVVLVGTGFYLSYEKPEGKNTSYNLNSTVNTHDKKGSEIDLSSSHNQIELNKVNKNIKKVDKPLESQQNSRKIIMKKSDGNFTNS